MHITEVAYADRSPEVQRVIGALSAAVYPPEIIATVPGIDLSWAHPQRSFLVWEDGQLVAHVSVVTRDVTLNGRGLRIGGIGGVLTHPAARGTGYASAAVRRAEAVFAADPTVAFALLACPPSRVSFYECLGWRTFGGEDGLGAARLRHTTAFGAVE